MGPQRLVTFVISALEMFLLTYLLTYLPVMCETEEFSAKMDSFEEQMKTEADSDVDMKWCQLKYLLLQIMGLVMFS